MHSKVPKYSRGVIRGFLLCLLVATFSPAVWAINPINDQASIPILPKTVAPNTIHVETNNDAALRAALTTQLTSNTLILIEPGVYILTKDDTFIFDGKSNIVIRQVSPPGTPAPGTFVAAPNPANVLINAGAVNGNLFEIKNSQNITFAHFKAVGAQGNIVELDGNAFQHQSNYRFYNCIFLNCQNEVIEVRDITKVSGALTQNGVTGIIVEYCHLGWQNPSIYGYGRTDGKGWCLYIENGTRPQIRNNFFSGGQADYSSDRQNPPTEKNGGIWLNENDKGKKTVAPIIDSNYFMACERSIYLEKCEGGGIVRNNMLFYTTRRRTPFSNCGVCHVPYPPLTKPYFTRATPLYEFGASEPNPMLCPPPPCTSNYLSPNVDIPITIDNTPNVLVLNNTVLAFPKGIILQNITITGAASVGGRAENNLVTQGDADGNANDIGVKNTAGAGYALGANSSLAASSSGLTAPSPKFIFVNPWYGDMRLRPSGNSTNFFGDATINYDLVLAVVEKTTANPKAQVDYDGGFRPSGAGASDFGADELGEAASLGGGLPPTLPPTGGGREKPPIRIRPLPGGDNGEMTSKPALDDKNSYKAKYNKEVQSRANEEYNQREDFRNRTAAMNTLYLQMQAAAKAKSTGGGGSGGGSGAKLRNPGRRQSSGGHSGVGLGN